MAVSGEFRYLGPAFSSVESVRPVNAITRPLSLAIGNITRLRNLEYMEETAASGFRRRASEKAALGSWLSALGPPSGIGSWADDVRRTTDDGFWADDVRRTTGEVLSFHDISPLSRSTSSLNSPFRRSRSRKPDSGAKPMRNLRIVASSSPRPARYSRARAPSDRHRHS